jgi:hypothetical protein
MTVSRAGSGRHTARVTDVAGQPVPVKLDPASALIVAAMTCDTGLPAEARALLRRTVRAMAAGVLSGAQLTAFLERDDLEGLRAALVGQCFSGL